MMEFLNAFEARFESTYPHLENLFASKWLSFILRWKNGISIHVCCRSFLTRKLRSDFLDEETQGEILLGRWVLQTIWWTEEWEKKGRKTNIKQKWCFFWLGRPAWFVFFPQDDANGCQWTAWDWHEKSSNPCPKMEPRKDGKTSSTRWGCKWKFSSQPKLRKKKKNMLQGMGPPRVLAYNSDAVKPFEAFTPEKKCGVFYSNRFSSAQVSTKFSSQKSTH